MSAVKIAQMLINRICIRYHISLVYQSKVGIKYYNPIFLLRPQERLSGEVISVSTDSLHLSIDWLKDPYTLLDTTITDSPHLELMRLLRDGGDVMKSDYMQRASAGTLDLRRPIRLSSGYLRSVRDGFEKSISSVRSDTYEPIHVVQVGGKYYIADGKHRAAVCAMEGVTPRCIDVTSGAQDSFFLWMFQKMLENKDHYQKNITYFQSAMKRG